MTYRQLLDENPDFRRLWSGQVISEIGDWLNNIAVLALVIELAGPGREGIAIGLYAIARHLPLFLFGPIAGVVVDRADRRRVMIGADLILAFLALGFLLAIYLRALPVIYAVGASLFSVSAFFNAAKRAAIPNIVSGAAHLLSANSLSASTTAATIAVGSALGGVVATFAGRAPVFVLNAVTFVVSAKMISLIRGRTRREGESSRVARHHVASGVAAGASVLTRLRAAGWRAAFDFLEGWRYVRQTAVLRAIFIIAAGWGLGNGAARALYSIFGARLGVSAASGWIGRPADFGISVLFVAMGVGGVLGAPIARRFNAGSGEALGSRMGQSMICDGIGLVVFSLTPVLWGASFVLVLREMNFAIWWTAQQTIMMKETDDIYSGRVFATYETLTTLMMVGAMLVSGLAADVYGITPVAAAGGTVITFSGCLWFLVRKHHRAHAGNSRTGARI